MTKKNQKIRLNFGPFGPKLVPLHIAFDNLIIYYMLDIVPRYHGMQFQGRFIVQTQ